MGERTERLVSEVREWTKAHNIKTKEIAEWLEMTPQGVTEIFGGRNQPTGEQALAMLELLNRWKRGQ